MSRLNNDVVGAQNAVTNSVISIVTSLVQSIAVLVVMFTLDWRLTLISIGCGASCANSWKPTLR